MFTYAAYGLRISSAIELAELVPTCGDGDVTIRLAPAPDWLAAFKASRYRLEIREKVARFWFDDVGAFEVRDGSEIDIIPEPGIGAAILRLYVQGMVLAMLLQQRGICVLHASVVRIHDIAVALCGPVGIGKSSLAAALVCHGCKLLSDDNAAISMAGGQATVASAYPFVKLYPEIASFLGFDKNELRPLHQVQKKVAGAVNGRFLAGSAPLRRIFMLRRGIPAGATLMPESQAVIELVRNSVPTRWGHSAGAAHFRDCVELARSVPVSWLGAFNTISGIQDIARCVIAECSEACAPAVYAEVPERLDPTLQAQL